MQMTLKIGVLLRNQGAILALIQPVILYILVSSKRVLKSISGRVISTVKFAPLAGMGTKVLDRMFDVQNLGLYLTLF